MKGTRHSLLPAVFAGLLVAVGCGADAATGVLITVVSTERVPSAVGLTWLDANHVLFRRRAPENGTLAAADAARFTVFIAMTDPPQAGPRRVVVRGELDDHSVSEGAAQIEHLDPGITLMEVTLRPGTLSDGDADGIPDEIDRCREHPDPAGWCPAQNDGGALEVGAIDPPIGGPQADAGQGHDEGPAGDRPAPGPSDALRPAPDAMTGDVPPEAATGRFRVGTFIKTNGVAGTRQVVTHGLGAPPRALLLWTAGRPDDQFGAEAFSIGVSDGPDGTSGSVAFASQDQANASLASRRMAARALTVQLPNGGTSAEADVVAWDNDTLTLSWAANDGVAYRVHYLIIGGEVAAKVRTWVAPVANNVPLSIAGVGFRPSVVMHFHIGTGSSTLPAVLGGGLIGTGVMTAAGRQWANAVSVQPGTVSDLIPTSASRVQRTDQALIFPGPDDTLTRQAAFVSMDADGFTTQFTGTSNAAGQVVSLALAGVSAAAGSFIKSVATAPADQTVGEISFRPAVVLLSSIAGVIQPARQANALLGLGASDDRLVQACSAVSDLQRLLITSATAVDRDSSVFIKATRQIEAEADLAAINPDGFRLRWTTNDAAPVGITYLTLGPP